MGIFDWSFIMPFLIKTIVVAFIIGGIGLLVDKFICYHEPEDDQKE